MNYKAKFRSPWRGNYYTNDQIRRHYRRKIQIFGQNIGGSACHQDPHGSRYSAVFFQTCSITWINLSSDFKDPDVKLVYDEAFSTNGRTFVLIAPLSKESHNIILLENNSAKFVGFSQETMVPTPPPPSLQKFFQIIRWSKLHLKSYSTS